MRANSLRILLVLAAATAAGISYASDFEERLAEVEVLRKAAAAAQAEWLATGRLLDEARAFAAAGDEEKALELVAKARFQAEAAIAQAKREAEAWQQRVIQ